MNAIELLEKLNKENIQITVDEGDLCIEASKGDLTLDLKKYLKKYKKEVIDILSEVEEKPIQLVDRTKSLSLSFGQQRLWFLNQFEGGEDAQYNIFWTLRLTGILNIAALQRALNAIAQRHESLRTRFQPVDNGAVQIITEKANLNIPVIDVMDKWVPGYILENTSHTFNLSTGPLIYVNLLRILPNEHVLIINMHHIVSDGWSIGVFNQELTHFYTAYTQGKTPALSPLPIQYADFAHWQRQWLQGEVLKQQVAYWTEKLSGAPALLELPTDKPRPATQSYRGGSFAVTLPIELSQQLHDFSRQAGVTLFMTLLTGFNILLARYSGQADICIGTPIANRQRPELENLIGFFVNTLVLRTQLSRHTTCTELLQQVKDTALSAYAHQDIPFEHLVEALQPERSLSYPPLFQVMFALQNAEQNTLELPGITVTSIDSEITTAKFDLTLSVEETGTELLVWMNYNTDLFDRSTIERMADHYQRLLVGMVDDPNQQVMTLPILSEVERQQILVDWNNTAVDYPADKCIHQLFEDQVRTTPNAIAVLFDDQQLTYNELNQRSNQLAHYLIAQGVGPDIKVGLCIERSLEMMVGLLGILKAGGAYVPIDPDYPQPRINYVMEHSNVHVLLTQESLFDQFPPNDKLFVLCLDRDWPIFKSFVKDNPEVSVHPHNLAYIIYTSGSTGEPKGVMCPHQGLANRLSWMQDTYQLVHTDRVLQKTPYTFDVSVWEFFWPIIAGARLVFAKPDGHKDPYYLIQLINTAGITTVHFVPSMLEIFINSVRKSTLGNLRRVICSGEALPIMLQEKFLKHLNGVELYNLYGPTEASIDVSFWRCRLDSEAHTVPIGRPIANTKLYILDKILAPVPIGAAGDLYIGGIGLARGYLKRSDLTAERFLTDPFSSEPDARIYKTGDVARYRTDGAIEYIGRSDHQVKIRGFRIELGEIENVLTQQSGVRQATVIAHSHGQEVSNHHLTAYIVRNDSSSAVDQATLCNTLQALLPDYMVPSFFIFLDALPLTTNGKVDRKALPKPDEDNLLSREYLAPRTEMETTLVAIWTDTLKLSTNKVGINDNFFDLGGHSLLATRVVSQIRKTFNVEIPIRALFTANTIRALAVRVETALVDSPLSDQEAYPLVPVDHNQLLPLSFAQQRLWFLNQFEDGESTQYNIPWALRLNGKLNSTALEKALNALIERHDSLRTRFCTTDDQTVQVIADNVTLSFPVIDIIASDITAQLAINANHVFDLAQAPLVQLKLLRLSTSEHILLINMHHIVSDGWSIGVFNQELTHLYTAYAQDKEPALPPLPIQYADFAHWQRQWLQGEVLERQVTYWTEQLRDAPALLELPTDRPRPATQSYRGGSLVVTLPIQLSQHLHALSRQHNTTLFMTLLTGFNILLARYSGQADICIGTPIANRQRSELENLIGFFINTLVLRTQLSSDTTCAELLQQVKETALSAYAHQDIPFEQLVEALQPERSLSYPPLFQVMFALQNAEQNTLELPGVTVSLLEGELTTAKFDLTLSVEESSTGLSVWLNYNTDLFDHTTAERMVDHYQRLLVGMVDDPNQQVMTLPILSEVERQQILIDWNNTGVDYPTDRCIHQLFEDQVLKTPNATAVVFDDQQLTYNELNQRSNQLAHYLIAQGVGPDIKVGLCLERSLEMMVGLLGILKAGGAYVPIDPDYPQQRIDYFIDNSGITLVLTQARFANAVLKKLAIHQLSLDQDWDVINDYSTDNPLIDVTPENLIYVIYTSGSTGTPKGVLINHSAYLNHMLWMLRSFTVTADDRILQKTPLNFDASAWEWSLPLICGASLIIAKPGGHRDPDYLLALIDHHNITVFQGVPSLVSVLLDSDHDNKLHALRYLFCGGEPLSAALCNTVIDQQLPATLCNLYGPTEATIDTTYWVLEGNNPVTRVPIGRPIDNVQLYLLDTQRNPVPIGVIGELYIGGSGLARGYLGHDSLRQDTFVTHSFDSITNTRLYRSGDLARYRPDGSIEYVGRTDDQVKVRGFRIELREIEQALADQDGIREAIVLAFHHEADTANHYLAAYLVHDTLSPEINQATLRESLKKQLPDFMIPSFFISIKTLPVTSNGKVDRKALPIPNVDNLLTRNYIAPRTAIEKAIVTIWADTLKLPVEKVGIEDNFFELGGHSLLATKLSAPLRKVCDQDIPLRTLFDYPTIASLVAAMDRDELTTNNNVLVNLKKEAVLDPDICASNAKYDVAKVARTILLTGATGFVGRFLLRELLKQTSAKVVCLVRSKNKKKSRVQAFERLKASLVTNQLWKANYSSRIDVVVGDISQPHLGLSVKAFASLANDVDVIYHNATAMNHIASYQALKTATVGSMQNILRLACTYRLKPVHYSSTISVFSHTGKHTAPDKRRFLHSKSTQERTVDEWSSTDSEQHQANQGYTSSKWVAEKLVKLAQARGIPCRIYRLGLISGDTQQGRYDADQWLYRLIASSIHIGCYPTDYCPAIGLLPVDIAAKSLVALSKHGQQDEQDHQTQTTFHLYNPHTLEIRRFFEVYNQTYGDLKPLQGLPLNQWAEKIRQLINDKSKHQGDSDTDRSVSIYPLMLHYANIDDDNSDKNSYPVNHIQCYSTIALLNNKNIIFPAIDQRLIKTYLQFILESSKNSPRLGVDGVD